MLLDDRGERPGAMFADWELIGVPHRVVLSDRGLKEGKVEYQGRRDASRGRAAGDDVVAFVKALGCMTWLRAGSARLASCAAAAVLRRCR